MARTGELVARAILAAVVGGIVGFVGWSIDMRSFVDVGYPAATMAAFAALAAGCARLGREAGMRAVRLQAPLVLVAGLLSLLLTVQLVLTLGAFLGAGHTARPDRISMPDAVTHGAFELAVACASLATGRVVAPLRGAWVVAGYAICVLLTATCGLALGLGIGEGYTWVAGSPCMPDQFCANLPIQIGVGLRLGVLLGAGLGLLEALALLAGDVLFRMLRARTARRDALAAGQ